MRVAAVLFILALSSLATFQRKNDVSSGPRVVPDRSGASPECALVLPRAFSVAHGSSFVLFSHAPNGFIGFSGLLKLFPY
jgi:hypothetical protein